MSLESQLKQQEGCSLELYRDTLGIATIGYGTNIERITQEEAEFLFKSRLEKTKQSLGQALPWALNLDPARRDVLINMAYNLGVPRLLGFKKMLGHCKLGEWKEAAKEGLDSEWRNQVKSRAYVLMRQLESGIEV